MRVYLPATSGQLRSWTEVGSAGGPEPVAYAVTPALREAYREGDLEELEWVAQVAAGMAALRLIAADPTALPLRFVLAAEVPDTAVGPARDAEHPAALRLAGPVPRAQWASLLADDPASREDQRTVAAAAAALRQGDSPGEPVQDRLDDAEAVELGWFGIQEIPALLSASA